MIDAEIDGYREKKIEQKDRYQERQIDKIYFDVNDREGTNLVMVHNSIVTMI